MREEGGSFDVTIGAYDGTEVCEIIGIYMLYLLGKKYDSKHIGLYWHDRLALLTKVNRPASEKKNIYNIFYAKMPANNYRVQLESCKLSWHHT